MIQSIKFILLVLALVFSFQVEAQVRVGKSPLSAKAKKLSKSKIEALKQTTTYFVLREADYPNNVEDFRKAIAKVWTITPFEIISPQEMENKDRARSSFFFFGGFKKTIVSENGVVHNSAVMFYDLFTLTPKGKKVYYGGFYLSMSYETQLEVIKISAWTSKKWSDKVVSFLFSEADIQNWSPLYVSAYLKVINDALLDSRKHDEFKSVRNTQALAAMKGKDLFLPDYVKDKRSLFAIKTKRVDDGDEPDGDYPFNAKYATVAQIDQMVASADKGHFYYLIYSNVYGVKYVSVYDSDTRAMIYSETTHSSYNFKNKDLRRLSRAVK